MGHATGASGTAHPFTGYNKSDIHGALVGNWVEERSLEKATGVFRYQEWVKESEQQVDSVYAKKIVPSEAMSTHNRVLEHSDRTEPKDYDTSNSTVYVDPASRTQDLRVYVDPKKAGVRTAMMLQALQAEAAVPLPAPPLEKFLTSTKQEAYVKHDLTGVEVGRRNMRTQDNEVVPPERYDKTWVAEAGIVSKATVDKFGTAPVPADKFPADYTEDQPVTLYTQKVEQGEFPSDHFFGSEVKGPNPFAKTSNFSKPISDVTKIMD